MFKILTFAFLLTSLLGNCQEINAITLEDIWQNGSFKAKGLQSMKWISNGNSYTSLVYNAVTHYNDIIKYDIVDGKMLDTLLKGERVRSDSEILAIEDYEFNEYKQQVLIATNTEKIYRYSYKAVYYLYDFRTLKLSVLAGGSKISDVTFSPDGQKIAYTKDNNLYYTDLNKSIEIAVTHSGEKNKIINGHGDWVYEEEYEVSKAFYWSPSSDKLAFCVFDETEVKEYEMQTWGSQLYPSLFKYKYPKAGEKNAKVGVHVYDLINGKEITLAINSDTNGYIPRAGWTSNNDIVYIVRQNRLQNAIELIHFNYSTNSYVNVLQDFDSAYVEINQEYFHLKDQSNIIFLSERDRYRHIYKYDFTKKNMVQLTKGNWEVDKLLGIDEENKLIFYTSTKNGFGERQVFSINFEGKKERLVIAEFGNNDAQISPNYKFLLNKNSTIQSPFSYAVYNTNGKKIRQIENNQLLKDKIQKFKPSPIEFIKVDKFVKLPLHAWIIKPADFDSTKKYPVLMYVYGGPGHQTVLNTWMGPNYYWFQLLAQKGYVIVSVDGRGTGGRGADFKKVTYNQLGRLENEDVVATAQFLGTLSFVDSKRIGIFGWSFGGYLSSLAITLGSDYFKLAVAVAPVTNWRFYDTIYTERFLKTPQENPKGYDDNSPINHADKLKGNYLIVHGSGDDNVHVQHTLMMQNALIAKKKKFVSMIYPDRDHGIYGGNTRLHLYQLMTDFILENL